MFEKFFNDPSFDFETRTLFGEIHYGAGDVGEMLTAVAQASRTATPLVGSANGVRWLDESSQSRTQLTRQATGQRPERLSAGGRLLRRFQSFFVDGTEGADAQLSELFAAHCTALRSPRRSARPTSDPDLSPL